MGVFKITTADNQPLRGGASREAGLERLRGLSPEQSADALRGLRANLVGVNGTPKHGVLKLRNSSSTGKGMEFARMRGMDRLFSKKETFRNTGKALQILMENSGLKPATAEALIKQYSAKDGSIRYKDAVVLINRVLPETSGGASVSEALQNAGITNVPDDAQADKVVRLESPSAEGVPVEAEADEVDPPENPAVGAYGFVSEVNDHGVTCLLKRQFEPLEIKLAPDGRLLRGQMMDGNQLAAGKVPGVITPNRYLVSKTDAQGQKSYHVVTAGRPFKQFCRDQGLNGATLRMEGLIMEKARGTQMNRTKSSASNLEQIAKGFASILMNASAHGIVFGDIKPQNAFVDGGKLTLIDTDAAFKHSKDAGKNPDEPIVSFTYRHPVLTDGLQQDLYSVGVTLLIHSLESRNADGVESKIQRIEDIVGLRPGFKYRMAVQDRVKSEAAVLRYVLQSLEAEIGQPPSGSVDDFAVCCIRTALKPENFKASKERVAPFLVPSHDMQVREAPVAQNYNTRFTGQDPHLLDDILDHPLIGGRDAFIQRYLQNPAAKLPADESGPPQVGLAHQASFQQFQDAPRREDIPAAFEQSAQKVAVRGSLRQAPEQEVRPESIRADDSDSKSAKGASKDGAIRDHNRLSNASSQSDDSDHPQKLDLKDKIMQSYQGAPQFSEE